MIGKRDMVQIIMGVIGIECSPPAVAALHADDPFGSTIGRGAIARRGEAIESKGHRRRIIQVGIVGVIELEGPPAGAQIWTGRRQSPITSSTCLALSQSRARPI